MIKNIFSMCLIAGSFVATSAEALEVTGGKFGLHYGQNRGTGGAGFDAFSGLEGSINLSFGGNFGVQIDAVYYDSIGLYEGSIGAHALYTFSPDLTFGAYFSVGDDGGAIWNYYGIEAVFSPSFGNDRLRFEGFVGAMDDTSGPGVEATIISIAAHYDISEALMVSGVYNLVGWGSFDAVDRYDSVSIEAKYRLDNGVFFSGYYRQNMYPGSGNDNIVGLNVGFEFGGGSTFDTRGYYNTYRGE